MSENESVFKGFTRSSISKTRSESNRLQRMKAELEAEKKLLTIEERRKELEQKKLELEENRLQREETLVRRQLEFELSEIDEMENFESACSINSKNGSTFGNTVEKHSFVNNWVEDLKRNKKRNYFDKSCQNHQTNDERKEFVRQETAVEAKMNKFMARQTIKKELSAFSGDAVEWLNFKCQFEETTKLCDLSDRENIARLQKCLKGKAREAVQALLNFPEELQKIMDILERRFGRPELIIEKLVGDLKNYTALEEDKPETLLDFSNSVQNLAITVKNLKCESYLWNPQLLFECVSKLPINLKMKWAENIRDLQKSRFSISILEFANWLDNVSNTIVLLDFPKEKDKKKKSFIAITTTGQERNSVKMKFSCICCRKDTHKLNLCEDFLRLSVEERWKFLKNLKRKICYSCLGFLHTVKECKKKEKCNVNGCEKFHHALLHNQSVEQMNVNHHLDVQHDVLLKVVPVVLSSSNKSVETFAFFDEGSTVTLLNEEIAKKLELDGPKQILRMKWTNDITHTEFSSMNVKLKIRGKNEELEYDLADVRTIKKLSLPPQSINLKKLARHWDSIPQGKLISFRNVRPSILIGQDNIDLIVSREIIGGKSRNNPIISRTKLGWVLHGKTGLEVDRVDICHSIFHISHDKFDNERQMIDIVEESYKIDNLGTNREILKQQNTKNNRAEELLEKTTSREGERWSTGLLWKEDNFVFPDNKQDALKRLKIIEKKFAKNKQLAIDYSNKIKDYVTKGYAKLCNDEDSRDGNNSKIWYLPHFPVFNPNKPNKMRFVFDAKAKSTNIPNMSFNDALLKGPDLLNNLLTILMKFRQRNIGFIGDIREMFHQIKIIPQDRKAQRFLWRENPNENLQIYEMQVMIFGSVCSPASAQYVLKKNAKEFERDFPKPVKAILEKHYMDDYVDSTDSVAEAMYMINSVIDIHEKGGFTMTNWISNSKAVINEIPSELRAKSVKDVEILSDASSIQKSLGLYWNVGGDFIFFELKMKKEIESILSKKKISTKRLVLKILMTIFDPLGFLLNFTTTGKILLQDIWRAKLNWDEELPDIYHHKWLTWLRELMKISEVKIPRCYVKDIHLAEDLQLHMLCDASEQAYSCVIYLRAARENEVYISFIIGKSRVSPLKAVSIPRLELQAALLGARLIRYVLSELEFEFNKIVCWSDSKTVLTWINYEDTRKFKPFVAHRLSEIKENTQTNWWRWIPSEDNVADDATRENVFSRNKNVERWLKGPQFLLKDEKNWPLPTDDKIIMDMRDPHNQEIRQKYSLIGTIKLEKEFLPKIERFSNWLRLIRTTAWMIHFINNLTKRGEKHQELTVSEIELAENVWIRQEQQMYFSEEIELLARGESIPVKSRLFKLSPRLDENGILRSQGRIQLAPAFVSADMKNPIILDGNTRYVLLLILYVHRKSAHLGVEYTSNCLKEKYWIIKTRTIVKKTLRNCQECKIKKLKPAIPSMGLLPEARMSAFVRPFSYVGVDFFGPLWITVRRSTEKRYGVMFTCLTVRAVHIELASSLDTNSCIMAIRRMIARRGNPRQLFSDNGTNLRAAEKELKEAWVNINFEALNNELTTRRIEWTFIPPGSPHMGGAWERLIRSFKVALYATLKERKPKEEILSTLIIECENIINNRPLTHVSIDIEDDTCLTPNHFLIGSSNILTCPGSFDWKNVNLKKSWQISQVLIESFWRRWIREYLPNLIQKTKWYQDHGLELKIGDVVVICDENSPRNMWPMGRIINTFQGRDGKVRSVEVKAKTGIFKRPVVKICKLEENSR